MIGKFKESLGYWSVRIAAGLAALAGVWPMIPDELKAWIPEEWRATVVAVVALSIWIARMTPQAKK